ncbi:MAG: Gfo/Idh/MocA family oxidoreductase, partial [Armatimonadetes bacterium]|nr:Gfo/Idh/MocA family oxidoreductase [Armatimonadota bacterium]
MRETRPIRVAIVGCGNIAGRYAECLATRPDKVTLIGAFDVDPGRTAAFASTHRCRPYDTLDRLLADPEIEAVINLTAHHAHAEVTLAALEAGKHVHSEKPLAATWKDAIQCVELAAARGLRLSCSPFTFLGEAQQTLRRALQDGRIGRVFAVYTEMNWSRIESWHADPEGFYQPGAGPLLD